MASGGTVDSSGTKSVVKSAHGGETRDAIDWVIRAWRSDPADRRALAGVRAEFLARYANAIQSGAADVGELFRAVINLMDRVGEGTVEANEAVVTAVGDAAALTGDPTRAILASDVGEVVERLDAYASGLTDIEFGEAPPPRELALGEPPLLTVRHDGVRVRPGGFEGLAPRKMAPGEVPSNELPVLVDAWEAIGDHLRGQLESVRSLADTSPDPELHRLSMALQSAVETIERLNQTMAAYARRVGG